MSSVMTTRMFGRPSRSALAGRRRRGSRRPRRDDRRHGHRRPRADAERQAPPPGEGRRSPDAVDSFPLCCPARATFITGQYAHNHGVAGQLLPLRLVRDEEPQQHPAGLAPEGRLPTALIGKWLNGYGARDAHGEVPAGFDIWRGLLDVSAYDYFNFVMNQDGRLRTWGDAEFARKLVEFAKIEVTAQPDGLAAVCGKLTEVFGPPP